MQSILDIFNGDTGQNRLTVVNAERLAGGLSVTDAEVMGAMAVAFQYLKVVVEPGGAVALAAVLSGRFECLDRTVAIVCSGGNVDAETFDAALR